MKARIPETPEYRTWKKMRDRCNNPGSPDYPGYGGRGIQVCESWKSFEAFLTDMGRRPPGTSLDRINNELGYSKENCRWATPKEQSNNTRRNRRYNFNGESLTLGQVAEMIGINYPTLYRRLVIMGWDFNRAISESTNNTNRKQKWRRCA